MTSMQSGHGERAAEGVGPYRAGLWGGYAIYMKTKMFVRDGMDGGFAGENAKCETLLRGRFVKRPYGFCFGALCS